MKTTTTSKILSLAIFGAACMAPMRAGADDIDIFTGASTGSAGNPRVLIVLDNTSNWARQSQQWPGGAQQGQSEVNAIKSVVMGDGTASNPGLNDTVDLGMMEFVTNGNANDDGGFIRYAVRPMTNGVSPATTNYKADFAAKLTTIYGAVTNPSEKRNSNTPYGDLMYDAYNYYAGASAYSPLSPPNPDTDTGGYTTNYTQFKSPLTADSTCGNNFIIFIGNPNASGPKSDSAANTAALAALGGDTSQLGFSGVTTSTVVAETSNTVLGNTTACYANLDAAKTAYGYALNAADNACELYADIGTAGSAASDKNSASCIQYSNLSGEVSHATATDFKTQCAALTEGCVLGTPIDNPTMTVVATGTTGYLASAPAATAADAGVKAGLTCPAGATGCTYAVAVATTAAASAATTGISSNNCYWDGTGGSAPSGFSAWSSATNDFGSTACPANYTCSYTTTGNVSPSTCPTNHTRHATLTQSHTPMSTYTVTQTATVPGGTCPAGQSQYKVVGASTVYSNVFSTTVVPDTGPHNADEWARFMHDKGIPVSAPTASDPHYVAHPSVITYTIDVYNKQPNAEQTELLMSMAKAGGGKYFVAKSESAIADALKQIMVEIQAVNSAFASTSLPVNATNRSQSENEVFIGMFRPDPMANPRWFGNMKRYQLVYDGSNVVLGDVNGKPAVNPLTGFLTPCATSYWTTDSGSYWYGMGINPDPASACDTSSLNKYSDAPDGPLVEKGAVAEVLRKAGLPSSTRNMLTRTYDGTTFGTSFVPFNAVNAPLVAATPGLVNFILGADTQADKSSDLTQPRPSIHGDVIHSRPLPINYGSAGVTVYYGANDGTFRAVNADSGAENWSFVAPEFDTRLARLQANTQKVSTFNTPTVGAPKDYFFDGSTGAYQSAAGASQKVWLFPTMRRGGRMIYAIDATSNTTPLFKWAVGCPNLTDDVGCTVDTATPPLADAFKPMGQSWSTPNVVFLKGITDPTKPVILVGGGYDKCDDENTATPSCTSNSSGGSNSGATGTTKGGVVYILDADTGAVLKRFNTDRAVAADIAAVDVNGDGFTDYAYAVDTGGKIYRINFVDGPVTRTPLAVGSWTINNVAYTNEASRRRKFLFSPAVLALQNKIYLAIGSGDREHPLVAQYPYEGVKYNRLYVYKDDPTIASNTNMDTDPNMINYTTNTDCTATGVYPSSSKLGWFMDLAKGEQVVTSALIAGGMATFSTNQPTDTGASCSNSLGTARGYWVNLFNGSGAVGVEGTCGGTRSSVFVGGGLPPSPVLASGVPVLIPATATTAATTKVTTVVVGAAQRNAGSSIGGVSSQSLSGGQSAGIEAQSLKIEVSKTRKRAYTYTSGD
jgi:Tfp pilus tip-associated adhesin PilY1